MSTETPRSLLSGSAVPLPHNANIELCSQVLNRVGRVVAVYHWFTTTVIMMLSLIDLNKCCKIMVAASLQFLTIDTSKSKGVTNLIE